MTNLADELERLATKLDDEPDAARRIYRTAALSLWVENNLPQILSALRAKPAEGEPVAWRRRGSNLRWEYRDDGSTSVVFVDWHALYTRPPVACPDREAVARIIDPGAFARHVFSGDPDWHPDDDRLRKNSALAKADAILALSASGGGE